MNNKAIHINEVENDSHAQVSAIDLTNVDVFRAIWHRQQPHLYLFANRILEDRQGAQDAATEAFIRLWKGNYQFTSEQAVASWLRITTKNICLDSLKAAGHQQQRLQEMTALFHNIEDQWNRHDILAERLQALYTHIEQLPPRGKEVFQLRYINGMKNEQIAAQLGITHQAVRDHLSKSLKTLRLSLRHREDLLLILFILSQQYPSA